MEDANSTWPFVIALAAVVNGIGVIRIIGGLGEYLRNQSVLNVRHYWVYTLLVVFQLMVHLLLWWSIIGLRAAESINFLSYIYLLIGPALLYLGTSIIVPDSKDNAVNLRVEYFSFRKTFFFILSLFWLWAIFVWPVFGHSFAPTVPLIMVWLAISITLAITANPQVHAALVTVSCIVYVAFVVTFAMRLGEVGRTVAGQ
jgi:hypothetical protein